jgi:hypothetical protein
LDVGSHRGRAYVNVYALNTALFGVTNRDELKQLTGTESLPVTRFLVPWDTGFGDFIDRHFKAFNVSLTCRTNAPAPGTDKPGLC